MSQPVAVITASKMGWTNRAAGRVLTHSTGLTPSTADTGEDLASMLPDSEGLPYAGLIYARTAVGGC